MPVITRSNKAVTVTKMTENKVESNLTAQPIQCSEHTQIESTIPIFEGDTGMPVDMWFENFEKNAIAYRWTAQQKYVYAQNRMRKSAELFLKTVSVCNYENLKSLLKNEFQKQFTSAEIHDKLRDRKMLNNESFYEYVLHMRSIGFLGKVDDKSIIKYIVDGIKGKSENKIVLYSALNYVELREHYEVYERIFLKNSVQKYNSNSNNNKTDYNYNNNNGINKEKSVHCFNCGSKDHKRNECKNEQKCFKCNQNGHIAKMCNNKRNVNCTWQHEMTKEVVVNGIKLQGLIDGGADITLIKDSVFNRYFATTVLKKCSIRIEGLGGATITPSGIFCCEIELDGLRIKHELAVVPHSSINFEVIVGFDVLKQFRYSSDERGYTFESIVPTTENEVRHMMNINIDDECEASIPEEIKELLDKMQSQYTPCSTAVGPVVMKIILEKEEPIYAAPGRLPIAEQGIVEKQIQE